MLYVPPYVLFLKNLPIHNEPRKLDKKLSGFTSFMNKAELLH